MEEHLIKVLLVEDNPGDARLVHETLAEVSSPQFQLTHVERLSEAQQRLGEEQFDVVLLDLSLTDSSRLESLISIHRAASKAPIVVFTGLDDDELGAWTVREGALDYLVKGRANSDQLVGAIRFARDTHHLRARRGPGTRDRQRPRRPRS